MPWLERAAPRDEPVGLHRFILLTGNLRTRTVMPGDIGLVNAAAFGDLTRRPATVTPVSRAAPA